MKNFSLNKYLIFLVVQLYALTTFAQWNGGNGTAGNPYRIATVNQLKLLSDSVNAGKPFTNTYFQLTGNLNLSGNAWTPIGTSARPFRGNFNGGGHIIGGLYINASTNDVGLFGYATSATISNLGVSTAPSGVNGGANVGILLGSQNGGTITNCYVMGVVSGTDVVGGLVGNQPSGTPTVKQCFANANVIGGTGANGVGGLVGVQRGNIMDSHAWCELNGRGAVGGLTGTASTNGITNTSYAGGAAISTASSRLGGLVGSMSQATAKVQNSVAVNSVLTSNTSSVGRVIGLANANITNNYAFDSMLVLINTTAKVITSNPNGIDGGSQSMALLKTQGFYSASVLWSIANVNDNNKIWNIWEGISLPYLQTQSSPVDNITVSGTTLQGEFRPDVNMDSISIFVKSENMLVRLVTASVNNSTHRWTCNDPVLAMNGLIYVIAYESGKAWPSYPVTYTLCALPPTFNTVDLVSCASAVNLQTAITNLQHAEISNVQFSKANGAAFDANIIPSPTTYSINGAQIIYAKARSNLGCQSSIMSFRVTQTGSLLFKEDFGNAGSSGGDCSNVPLPSGVTTYTFGGDLHENGRYGMCSRLNNFYNDYFYVGSESYDHTNPGTGRSLIVNADFEPGKFYTLKIDNLCPGTRLYFSAWVFNLLNPNAPNTSYYLADGVIFNDPDLLFEVRDANNNELLAQYNTGSIPKVTNPALNWRPYGFEFVAGASSSITLTLYNYASGGNGNDLMIDDIEVYLCVPQVAAQAASGCGIPTTLTATYTDDGTFTAGGTMPLQGYWLKSTTGNANSPADWQKIQGSEVTMPNGETTITSTWIEPAPANGITMYYRFVTANNSSMDNVNCRASSEVLPITGQTLPTFITTDTTFCEPATINLQQCIASLQGTTMDKVKFSLGTGSEFNSKLISDPINFYDTATTRIYVVAVNPLYPSCQTSDTVFFTLALAKAKSSDITSVTGDTICMGSMANLSATTNTGFIPRWYSDIDLTNFLFEGNNFTTPSLNASATYYVSVKNNVFGCIAEPPGKLVAVIMKPQPEANFIQFADDTDPFLIYFSDSSQISSDSIVAWSWDFSDGNTSSVQNPTHQFAQPEADHLVSLVTLSSKGCIDTVSYLIHAGSTLYAEFNVADTIQCLNDNLFVFTNISTIALANALQATYLWTFGDGNSSTLENPTHHYAATGDYEVKLIVTVGGVKDSSMCAITVSPMPLPLVSKQNDTICEGISINLNTLITPAVNTTAIFYTAINGSPLASTLVAPLNSTKYYISIVGNGASCSIWDSLIVSVNPAPSIPDILSVTDADICTRGTASINAVPATGYTPRWYSDAALTNFLFEGTSYVTPVLTTTTSYYAVAKNIATGCIGGSAAKKTVIVTVNPLPTATEITSVVGATICSGSTATLMATAATGFVPQWYADAALTNFLFEGINFLTPAVTTTTTYYVVVKNISTGCIGDAAAATPVTVTVNPLPSSVDIVSVIGATICDGNTATISATATFGFTPLWYNDPMLTTILFEGADYTTSTLTSTTTYYVTAKDITTGCSGNATAATQVTVMVNPQPTADDILNVANTVICSGSTATVTATAAFGFTPYWYSDAALNNFLFKGNSYTTPTLTASATYYVVAATSGSGSCIADAASAKTVQVTVNPLPTLPTLTIKGNTTIPWNTSTTLEVLTPVAGTIRWYDMSQNHNLLHEGAIYTTPVLTENATYYLRLLSPEGCEGTAQQEVLVTVNTDIAVAEAITPNGDGHNDTWTIKNIERYPNNLVTIFNRWGDKVYEKNGYSNSMPWGAYANVSNRLGSGKVPRGTYFYVIQLNDDKRLILKGYVEVIY